MTGYSFTKNSAERIAKVVRTVEGPRDRPGVGWWEPRGRAAPLQIGKTTAAWTKGTTATVEVYSKADRTNTGNTADVFNMFADIEADKWVAFISGYLVAAECDDPPVGA